MSADTTPSMLVKTLPYFSVQPDWNTVVDEVSTQTISEGSFWISHYTPGQPTIHATIHVKKEGQIVMESGDGISVEPINSRSFTLTEYNKKTNILGPTKLLKLRIEKSKSATILDVSNDGKLYAAANGTVIDIGDMQDGAVKVSLKGHVADVNVIKFFPSNQVVLSGAEDFQIKIWSVLDGSNPVTLVGHSSDLSIISKGRNILSSSRDGTIRLWNCGTAETIAIIAQYDSPINKILLLPLISTQTPADPSCIDTREVETMDKMVLAALGNGSVKCIHLGTKNQIAETNNEGEATAIAYDSELTMLFVGYGSGVIHVYSMDDPSNRFSITAIALVHDQKGEHTLCIAAADGAIYKTNTISDMLMQQTVSVSSEFTGNELDPVYSLIVDDYTHLQPRIICSSRDGYVKTYSLSP